jgi:hypothetical protein
MKKAIAWVLDHGQQPKRLPESVAALEQRLEDWIDADIEIVTDDVLLIGRQVLTSYGTKIDLLGIDAYGNLVIIELKRNQTLRETVAQGIEYAAWASKCLYDEILEIAANRFGSKDKFEREFLNRFGHPLPDALNDSQRVLLVAPEITDSTAAVIEYLSQTFRVPINGVSFDLFSVEHRQLLVRHFVREESIVATPPSKRRPHRTLEELVSAAHENGVGDLVEHLLGLQDLLPDVYPVVNAISLKTTPPGSQRSRAAFTIYPTAETNPDSVRIWMLPSNFSAFYNFPLETSEQFVRELQALGKPLRNWGEWWGAEFTSLNQVEDLVHRFREFVSGSTVGKPSAGVPEIAGAPGPDWNSH